MEEDHFERASDEDQQDKGSDEEYSDDKDYDDEEEEDRGEPEDIADNEMAQRIAEHEAQAGEAALIGLEITEENQCQEKVTNVSLKKQAANLSNRKGRGPTRGLKKESGPLSIEYDSLKRPKGSLSHQFGQNVGFCMRKVNINWEWKSVSKGLKNAMWHDTMSLFNLSDDPELKKIFLSTVAKRFADFKAKLVNGWITKTRKRTKREDNKEPHQVYKHIKIEDWELFKKRKTSEHAAKIRERAIKSAKMNKHHHHMGQLNYEESRKKWIDEGFYPACKLRPLGTNTDNVIQTNHGDDWYCAVQRIKKTGQREIQNPETKKAADLYLEYRDKQKKGEFTPIRNKGALHMALGEKPDHFGRVRGVGGINVGIKKVFGKPDLNARRVAFH